MRPESLYLLLEVGLQFFPEFFRVHGRRTLLEEFQHVALLDGVGHAIPAHHQGVRGRGSEGDEAAKADEVDS